MLNTIGALGEFGLIARLTAGFPQTDDVIIGPGDDAALVRAGDGRVVATTDLLVEGRHFRRDWSTARDVGHKAAAQNLADVAAMGARPTVLLLGLAAPPELPVDWVDGFAAGLAAECAAAGAAVAGGDTVGAATLTIAITALGDLGGVPAVRRDGARPGDVVAVAGNLGMSAVGLDLLRAGLPGPDPCLDEHRRPRPPYREGPRAAALGASAMLDVSDGLLQDLGHIAAASGVAIDLDPAALRPASEVEEAVARLAAAGADPRRPLDYVLAGGEDHALAATFPASVRLPGRWSIIGRVDAGEGVTVDGSPAAPSGWDHFS
ncbi:thiamine-phosphate kinase [Marinactinospora thermotolerans]|uniref:Thiamine-monophosphate kinase n=1 Tax=Marinactinospora thermotolerans DSM 45154 TaxID=1122192 RepID=A0A1T4SGE3_9ACTN|nr:thiamine-phosphate kinase [Marinactinospora thermotolerans]SKA26988.1 thiamine-phosphate kinase [Marinactinospora thermotolerans DSM 45154]